MNGNWFLGFSEGEGNFTVLFHPKRVKEILKTCFVRFLIVSLLTKQLLCRTISITILACITHSVSVCRILGSEVLNVCFIFLKVVVEG